MWIGEMESSKFGLSVLNKRKNRGVQDILIICVDNLTGLSEAISASFLNTEIQKCTVHQVRNRVRYVSYMDLKKFTTDLKLILQARRKNTPESNYGSSMRNRFFIQN